MNSPIHLKKVELYAIISSRQKTVMPILKPLQVGGNMNITFQFNCNNEICLSDIFGKNYEYINLTLENFEDNQNRINVKISQFSFGCATRLAGESARNLVLNYLVQSNYSQIIILNFSGVSIIASSFADEFIGKLLQEYGFIQFNNLIRITNIGKENMSIINRSVMQHISEND